MEDKLLRKVKLKNGLFREIVCRTGFKQWSSDWMVKLDTNEYVCLWEEDIVKRI